jgi:hypothetical protein
MGLLLPGQNRLFFASPPHRMSGVRLSSSFPVGHFRAREASAISGMRRRHSAIQYVQSLI